ncbi:MAG: hypothetical protein ACTHJR_06840 [Sphingomonas sp.]|uniref:hypothetical protein n=1 Tax=Sphingomonas sp. TaxID=28214 RepID=UPI003F80C6BE
MIFALALLASSSPVAHFRHDLHSCGIDDARAIVEHDEGPEDREAGIAGSAPVSDAQMKCIAAAAAQREYFVEFADPALSKRFIELTIAEQRESGRKIAREWLAQHHLLDKLPVLAPDEDLASFAVRMENFCGFAPHTGLQLLGPKSVTLAGQARPDAAKVECLVLAFGATDLREGMSFGLIGNETYQPSDP